MKRTRSDKRSFAVYPPLTLLSRLIVPVEFFLNSWIDVGNIEDAIVSREGKITGRKDLDGFVSRGRVSIEKILFHPFRKSVRESE